MKKLFTLAVIAFTMLGSTKAQETEVIGKSNIKLNSRMMTPEAMWAMGRRLLQRQAEQEPSGYLHHGC